MSRLRIFFYSLEDGLENIKRGGINSFISIITIAFAMLNLGLFFLLWINISPLLEGCLDEVKITCYLKEGIVEEKVESLTKELNSIVEVKKVSFVSKAMAMERFKALLGEDEYLLDGLDENPLPASLEVLIDEKAGIDALDQLSKKLSNKTEFEEIQSGQEWIQRLSIFRFLIKVIGFLVGGVLFFISIFIISNTVRLNLLNRKEEVEIMRLVGANRWFIKTPFFIEGLFNGFLGGIISIIFLYLLFQAVKYRLSAYIIAAMGMMHISFIPVSVIFILLGLGMSIGGVGSLFSLKF